MTTEKAVKVMCVDDEERILESVSLHLRRDYDVVVATSPAFGQAALESQGPFAIVLSDLRMVGGSGIDFLSYVRERSPNTIRMLLTGHADVDTSIAAVNEGQVFRFLTKPCPPDTLKKAFRAAYEQYQLVTAERVLLEQTLHGSIKTLVDVLALTNPLAFGRATRIKQRVSTIGKALGVREMWQVEVAAMLSQVGCITLPVETVEKLYYGQKLSDEEKEAVEKIADVTERLLGNIPRLEIVRSILKRALSGTNATIVISDDSSKAVVAIGTQLLRAVLDFDELESCGHFGERAVAIMRSRKNDYGSNVLDALEDACCTERSNEVIRELPVFGVREGMILADDLKTGDGTLLVARGYEVTAGFVERIRGFRGGLAKRTVRVIVHGNRKAS